MQEIVATDDAQLEVRDIAAPEEPPSGHVLFEIEAAAINHGDKLFLARPSLPGDFLEADTVFGQPPPLAQSSPLLRMFQSSMQAGRSRPIGDLQSAHGGALERASSCPLYELSHPAKPRCRAGLCGLPGERHHRICFPQTGCG